MDCPESDPTPTSPREEKAQALRESGSSESRTGGMRSTSLAVGEKREDSDTIGTMRCGVFIDSSHIGQASQTYRVQTGIKITMLDHA